MKRTATTRASGGRGRPKAPSRKHLTDALLDDLALVVRTAAARAWLDARGIHLRPVTPSAGLAAVPRRQRRQKQPSG